MNVKCHSPPSDFKIDTRPSRIKMHVALFLECFTPESGGGFQQALSMVKLTHKNASQYDFVVFTPFERIRQMLSEYGIKAILFKNSVFRLIDRWSARTVGNAILRRVRQLRLQRLGRHLDALLDDYGIDLVVLTEIGECALRIGDHPFIIPIPDQFNRDYPEFSDTYANVEYSSTGKAYFASR